jgi:azurin
VGTVSQGAAVWLPGDFLSGAQQGRINPRDGQLYVTGMYGWGCWGKDDGSIQRVRYSGGAAYLPTGFALHENGVLVRFSDSLDSAAAEVGRHFVQCWNYRYSRAYGSPELRVAHPGVEGHDVLEITGAHLLDGGRSLFLEIPLLTPCHQVHLHVSTGENRYQDLYATAHVLAPAFADFPGYKPTPKVYLQADRSEAVIAAKPNPWKSGPAGRTLEVTAALGLKFAQMELHAKAGEALTVRFVNPDAVPHNWVLIKPGTLNSVGDAANRMIAAPDAVERHYVPESTDVLAYTDMTNPGESFEIHIQAPAEPGRYPYLCTFPGHWVAMNGMLIVEK